MNMSFSATIEQVRNKTKTVTRRHANTWKRLKVGDVLWAVEKAQGLKKGEKIKRICQIRITSIWTAPLTTMTPSECALEGFPRMSVRDFWNMFCSINKCDVTDDVKRIEFEYLEEGE